MDLRLGVLVTHPVQYLAPWFRLLASRVDLQVYYAHRQDARGQAEAGFGVAFEWDTPLLEGYRFRWLTNVARSPGLGRFSGCDTPEIAPIIRAGRFDAFVIFGWNTKSYLQGIRACRRYGVPVFIRGDSHLGTPRALPWRTVKFLAYRLILPRLGRFLTVGQRNREYLLHYGVAHDQLHFVPHFVDTEWFGSRASAASENGRASTIRERFNAAPGDFLLLYVGKLIRIKRVADFVKACHLLSNDGTGARVKGLIVGDGPLRAELESTAAAIPGTVAFAGFQNQSGLPDFYAACDAIILPSESESWGLVVNEAQACGKPAIVSDEVGCAPDLVDDRLTGFTYRSGDVAMLAQRITQLRELLRHEAADVRASVLHKSQRYSMQAATDALLSAIRSARQ